MAQFPLEMGRKKKTSNALAVQVDAEGKVKYDAIARQGQNKDKVHRHMTDSAVSKGVNTQLKTSIDNLENVRCNWLQDW